MALANSKPPGSVGAAGQVGAYNRLKPLVWSASLQCVRWRTPEFFVLEGILACHVSGDRFASLVEMAMEALPEPFASHMEMVRIEVLPRATSRQLKSVEIEPGGMLFGLYVGVSELNRSVEHSGTIPEVIYIFQDPHEQVCDSPEELLEEVRMTFLHELGHHFGMDEDDLEHLGYG